ncbi:MAG: hypothetical protein LUI09_08270, partial [Prevotellaceae bacterium]|nr:hypothetical protein [Prevotellaceae bacterium]
PWTDSIAPSAPSRFEQRDLDAQMTELRWDTCADNLCPEGVRYNVYASPASPVDVTKAENLVASCLPEPFFTFNRRLGLSLAVTALDRCGNESAPLQIRLAPSAPASAPQPHYLPTDGTTLTLPSAFEAEQYSITDLAGRPLLTGRWQEQADISSLERGVYRLCALPRKGSPRIVAEFRK